MSDDLNITHGGAIAVDPDALRAVANDMIALAGRFSDAASSIRTAYQAIINEPGFSNHVDTVALWASGQQADALFDECQSAATNTLLMADAYELVERRIELAGLAIQGEALPHALMDRIAELEESDPRVPEMEAWLIAGWRQGELRRPLSPDGDPFLFGPLGGLILGIAALLGSTGLGVLPPGTKLSGTGGPVSVKPVPITAPAGPPSTIGDALRRLPESPGAQIKVEKYTMPDGSKKFVLYGKGTQLNFKEDEPFDAIDSNSDLYLKREESASYAATVAALEAAGAEPGDDVHVYAHSQAAMNAAYLAMQSEFEVPVMVTAGSPNAPTLDADQLLVQLRHHDDPVSSLAGGGLVGGTGAPNSIVITRDADPNGWLWNAHTIDGYIETADLAEDSNDVRLNAWREKTSELSDAVSIEVTEYVATRD